ncbi:transposase [Streptomyces sp. NPDC056480]|uniref:transposase n=1 Tax=Streptomyces sp. NPDC056480 TaxID=3345833 RepID=UPI0036AFFC7D
MMDHDLVIGCTELSDVEWELLAPLIPSAVRGRPHAEDRRVINGSVCKIRTGVSWCDLPVCRRRSVHPGLQQIHAQADAAGDIDWLVQIDSTIIRAHQHAAATGRKGASMAFVKS